MRAAGQKWVGLLFILWLGEFVLLYEWVTGDRGFPWIGLIVLSVLTYATVRASR